jgi:chemotaxis protein CheD
MLPDSSIDLARAAANPHIFVDTGVPELLRRLTGSGSRKKDLRWCLTGGAAMMGDSAPFEVGKRNHVALKKVFWRLGVFIDQEDVGGTDSRSVKLDLQTGAIVVRTGTGRENMLRQGAVNLMTRNSDAADFGR